MSRRTVNRSAITGKFVSNAAKGRWPNRTITERVGKGTNNNRTVTRSATTGRFVTKRWGDENPNGTVRQRV